MAGLAGPGDAVNRSNAHIILLTSHIPVAIVPLANHSQKEIFSHLQQVAHPSNQIGLQLK
jgi:hypothetical protein